MLFRMAGGLDDAIASGVHILAALEEFAVEASIIKVAGSEMMDVVVDENVQIHGGNGFVRDYAAERHYRDARVNRIFEGTNEINRTLIPTMLARKMAQAGGLTAFHTEWTDDGMTTDQAVNAIRGAALTALTKAAEHFGKRLGEEQQVLMHLADMLIDTFACDSVLARAGASGQALHEAAATVFVFDAVARVHSAARNLARAGSFRLESHSTAALGAALAHSEADTITARQQIADAVLSRRAYPFA
jgi:hypothetical protein